MIVCSRIPLFPCIVLLLLSATSVMISQPMPGGIKGMAVATCYSGADNTATVQDNFVVAVIDVHSPVGPGAFWPAPMYHGPANSWKASRLGQIFGIAIDKRNHVYVTPTTCYPNYSPASPLYFGSAGSGGVYKLDGVTGAVSDLITTVPYNTFTAPSGAIGTSTIPNGNGTSVRPGLGNICYSRTHDRLYLTNHEDGIIYRINPLSGLVDAVYDPVAPASPGTTTNPAMVADAGTLGYAPLGDQLWGIAYNPVDNRLYYAVWMEHGSSSSPTTRNVIRSVGLDGSGNIMPATDQLEVELPDYMANNWSMPVADIAFPSEGNTMLVAERGMASFNSPTAHASRVLKYARASTTAAWGTPATVWIGAASHTNAAGGVDYGYGRYDSATGENLDCDSVIWATGDYMHFATGFGMMYGAQRTPATGNTPTTVSSTGYFIDFDGIASTTFANAKTNIGDIEVFRDSCGAVDVPAEPCDLIQVSSKPHSISDTSCCWVISVTGVPQGAFSSIAANILTDSVTFSGVTGPSGWGVANSGTMANWTPPGSVVPAGSVDSLIFCLYSLVNPPQEIEVVFYGADGSVCRDTIRVDCEAMPPPAPSCLELTRQRIECKETGPNGSIYDFSFSVTNFSPFSQAPWNYPAENLLAYSITPGVSVVPGSATFGPLGYGATSAPLNFTISGAGAMPGDTICLVLQLHGAKLPIDYVWCCPPDTICIVLPPCKDCCDSVDISMKERQVRQVGNSAVNLSSSVAVAPGPVMSASATIMSVDRSAVWCPKFQPGQGFVYQQVNAGGPVLGQITNAVITPSLPVSSGILPPTSVVTWGTVPAGVNMTGGVVGLQVGLPGSSLGWRCRDTLTICVRYSFTDTACRTCDTVVYYSLARIGKLEIVQVPDDKLTIKTRMSNPLYTENGNQGTNPLYSGDRVAGPNTTFDMTDGTNGVLTLEHWWQDDLDGEPGTRLVEMQVEAAGGVAVTEISEQGSGISGRVIDRRGIIAVNLEKRTADKFDLRFDVPNGLRTFPLYVVYRYVDSDNPEDTVTSGQYVLYGRIPGESGGDVVLNDNISERPVGVRTFMLYFVNNNQLKQPVDHIELTVNEDGLESPRILAVGPPNEVDPTRVGLSFVERVGDEDGADGAVRLVPANHNTTRSNRLRPVAPGDSVIPIIITVAGVGDKPATVEYRTYDAEGNLISEGSLELQDPLQTTSVHGDNGGAVTGSAVQLYAVVPNPGNGDRAIRFQLARSEPNLNLALYDAVGNQVLELIGSQAFAAGNHTVVVNPGGIATGTYYVVLKTAKEQVSTIMQVVR